VREFFFRMLLLGILLAALRNFPLMAQGDPEAAKIKNPVAATQDSLNTGQQLYQRHCASCHGKNGQGGSGNDLIPAAPSLIGSQWKHGSSDGEIFKSIKEGVPPDFNMTPWGDRLKDQDIWNILNYIRSLAKK
jgi:mono/diheme cytochrome c family protein